MTAYIILGIGAPIMDSLLPVSEEFITAVPGKRHGMQPVDYATLQSLVRRSGSTPHLVTGGSTANTMQALAMLGRSTALAGMVGDDSLGRRFLQEIAERGVTSLIKTSSTPTAQVLCLITPDGHRTCRTYLGASLEFSADDLQPTQFENVQLVHIEGYSLPNPGLTLRSMQLAKAAGALVSLDLSSHETVAEHRTMLVELLRDYVDIVIGNEDELEALLGVSAEQGCATLAQWVEVAVVLRGADGCLIGNKETIVAYPAYPTVPLDTTGAGDLFIAGFLHGYLDHLPLQTCAHFGAVLGNAVVQVLGTDLSDETWKEVKKKLSAA